MKKLFLAIRKNHFETVKALIEKKPELVNCTAKQPPKKDDGQSPLQVALKTGRLEIADFLIEHGADLNFMESEDCANDWRTPVLHDAVLAAVMNCRHTTSIDLGDKVLTEEHSTEERADAAFAILKKMLERGADVHRKESFGASCAWRLCKTAEEILPCYSWGEKRVLGNAVITPETEHDLCRIFLLLKEHGTNFDEEEIRRFRNEKDFPVSRFLKCVM